MLLSLVSLAFSLVNSERALSVFITQFPWKLRYVDQHEQAKKCAVRYTFFSLKKKKVHKYSSSQKISCFFRLHLFPTDCLIRIKAAKTEKDQRILCSLRLLPCLLNL